MSRFQPFVEEACTALGLVRPDHARWVAKLIERYGFDAPRMARTDGTPMTVEERRDLKLGNLKMSNEAWAALSDRGRHQPGDGIEFTIRRAMSAMQRDRERTDILLNAAVQEVEVQAWDPCAAVEALQSVTPVLPKHLMPRFPLAECQKVVCDCRVTPHYKAPQWASFSADEANDTGALEVVAAEPQKPGRMRAAAARVAKWTWNGLALFGLLTVVLMLAR